MGGGRGAITLPSKFHRDGKRLQSTSRIYKINPRYFIVLKNTGDLEISSNDFKDFTFLFLKYCLQWPVLLFLFTGLAYLDRGGDYGQKIFHRGSVWPHLPLHSRAASSDHEGRVTHFLVFSCCLSLVRHFIVSGP